MTEITVNDSRQRIWTALINASTPLSLTDIATFAKAEQSTAERYMTALKNIGYTEYENGEWVLVKKTGSLSVRVSAEGQYRDYNIHPPMHSDELFRIINATGLSYTDFAVQYTGNAKDAPRIRKMANGYLTITPKIEEIARKLGRLTKDNDRN